MGSLRTLVQAGFLLLTLVGVFVVAGNAERWCPFGGVEAVYTYATEGNMPCSLGTSNFFVLGGLLLTVLLLRRAFCGYACPIGAISEWLGKLGRFLHIPRLTVSRRWDSALSLLKYGVLAVILYYTWSTAELVLRGYDPCYALIGRHGEDITSWAYVISGVVVLASLVTTIPFCRWLCPLAAVMNPVSRIAPARVVRDENACIECGECSLECPMAIPVAEVEKVGHARCTGCLDCVAACPEPGVLSFRLGGARLSRPVVAAAFVLILAGAVAAALLAPLPSFTWERGEAPEETASVTLHIENLNCRGNANLLVYFLSREDDLEIPGYLRLEAWPGPGTAKIVVTYDPAQADEDSIRMAITEMDMEAWRPSPFVLRCQGKTTETRGPAD